MKYLQYKKGKKALNNLNIAHDPVDYLLFLFQIYWIYTKNYEIMVSC